MKSSRLNTLIVSAMLLATVGLAGSANAAARPVILDEGGKPTSSEAVDVTVRNILRGYLAALNSGNYAEAAAYWSPNANVKAANLKVEGVSDWFFISSEMINSTGTTANVQLNFSVKVAPGASTGYNQGRNVRYVRLVLEPGGWKIQSITTSP